MIQNRFAVLDIGSNTFNFVISEIDSSGTLRVIFQNRIVLRLGNYDWNGITVILPEKFSPALHIIKECLNSAKTFGIDIHIFATSAVREAVNRNMFISKVKEETGLEVNLISGEQEAELVFKAISRKLMIPPNPLIAIDIGGGSTEIIFGKSGIIESSHSLKLGTVRLKEHFFKETSDLSRSVSLANKHISDTLSANGLKRTEDSTSICSGSSGVIKIAMEYISSLRKPASILGMLKVEHRDFEKLLQDAAELGSIENIAKVYQLEYSKADVLLPGLAILAQTLKALGLKEIIFSDYGLREGIVFELLYNKS